MRLCSGPVADESEKEPSEEEESAPEAAAPSVNADESSVGKAKAKPRWVDRAKAPTLIWMVCAIVYVAFLGGRIFETSPDNHYAHLANSWLEGRLDHGANPPGTNDWACFDTELKDLCPNNRFSFSDHERYRWYVSFPPFPAAVIAPAVAVLGVDMPDRFYWALIAALGPAFLWLLFRRLRETRRSSRTWREDLALTLLFAFGSVFFYVAVQGTVWFAAHAVAVPLIALYVLYALDARAPLRAGLILGLCFLTRPTTALLCIFFGFEAMRTQRKATDPSETSDPDDSWWRLGVDFVRGVDWKPAIKLGLKFSAPILVCGGVAMWMNAARFDDPFEFGHSFLQIRWRGRIERWGLFNYHYMAKNIGVFGSSLPWLSIHSPYVQVSRHGLALWVTTPALLMALWPKKLNKLMVGLWCALIPVAILNLMYQNSGWAQFGYRFALDYMVLIFVIIALGKRRFGVGFALMMVWAIAINAFGAVTFNRMEQYYSQDSSQEVMYQPD
ncbi:MAG: hypothetical protein ACI9KE_005090 [Polyangiales bacterium]|jgi:hypothetical protein